MKMILSPNSRCLIATPVSHLGEVKKFIHKNEKYFVLHENGNRDSVMQMFANNPEIRYIFVNPNAQGYIIDREFMTSTRIAGINTCSTGTNHIDLSAVEQLNIALFSLTYDLELISQLPSTAELAFGLMLGLCRSIINGNNDVVANNNWNYTSFMGRQLKGQTVGVLGYGRLGKMFAQMLRGFDVRILVCEENVNIKVDTPFERVDIVELFSSSNIVALHIHSSPNNKQLINRNLIGLMPPNSYLINTSRGDICNEEDISSLLVNGQLGGYATDVLATEFTDIQESPIHRLAKTGKYNIIITPHVGGMTVEGQEKAFLYALNKFELA